MSILNHNSLKIGYIILISTHKFAIEKLQRKAGYSESSKWTHVAGSLGGYTAIEANIPRSRLINPVRNPSSWRLISNGVNLQREYVDRGYEIKVMRPRGQEQH